MKVILLKDIEKIGKKFDVKEVKNGYARNYLIPNGSVKPATKEALKWLEMQKEILEKKAEDNLKKVEGTVSAVDGLEVIISVKTGDQDQLFEKITAQKISEKIKEMGFEVKKNQIDLEKPIETIGEFPVKLKFEDNLEADIKVIVNPIESEKKENEEEE
jgi:large subunit ribosomal protein L9